VKLKLAALAAVLFIFIPTVRAQSPAPLIINAGGRHTLSLNGRWQTIIDPYETGFYDYRTARARKATLRTRSRKAPAI